MIAHLWNHNFGGMVEIGRKIMKYQGPEKSTNFWLTCLLHANVTKESFAPLKRQQATSWPGGGQGPRPKLCGCSWLGRWFQTDPDDMVLDCLNMEIHGDIIPMAIPWGISKNGQNRMMMNQWMDVEWDALLSDAILSSDEPCSGSLLDFLPSTASTSLSPPLPVTPHMFSIHLHFESCWLIVQCCFQCKYS